MRAGIVGAGIMGKLLGFALKKINWDVTIFDDAVQDNCSMAAAGLLTPLTELEKNDAVIAELGLAALNQHWPTILSQLSSESCAEIYFQKKGCLALAHPRDKSELDRLIQYCPKSSFKKMNYDEMTALEPDINKFQEGYYFAEEGQIDNQGLLICLETYLSDKINLYKKSFVYAIKPKKIFLKNDQKDNSYDFDWVFDCRGLGAKSVFNNLRGVRGELIWLHAPQVSITRPIRFLHPRYSLYIVPRPHQIYLLGASEIESEDNTAISVRSLLELLTAAYYIQPKFAEARVIKTVTQCRPTLTHHLPQIKYAEGFIAVNGLYRHGFLIAPTLMNEIIKFLDGGVSALDYPQLWEKYI